MAARPVEKAGRESRRQLLLATTIFLLGVGCGSWPGDIATTLEILDASGTPKESFAEGEEITFVITVRNDGGAPYRATGTSTLGSAGFSLFVTEEENPLWMIYAYPRPLGHPSEQIEVYVEPGGEKTTTIVWDQSELGGSPVGPGSYVAEGAYPNPSDNMARRDFTIE